MSLIVDYENVASHISEYIENGKLFDAYAIEAIEEIMKYSKLTPEQFNTLLKECPSTMNARKIYICTRKATVSIQNKDDVVSLLKSVKKYMKINLFDGIIDFLNQQEKEILDCREENKKLREELKSLQNPVQNASKEMNVKETADKVMTVKQINEDNSQSREILSKIAELKKYGEFYSILDFLCELSAKGNHEMMLKACEEGLWETENPFAGNVLHYACASGKLKLVKSLIECNCNKESLNQYGQTPLIQASSRGYLEIVKYLISVGANKEAKTKDGWTPLILASREGHLAVVQYLISVGANKDAKTNDGKTSLSYAKGEIRDYLKSIGAK